MENKSILIIGILFVCIVLAIPMLGDNGLLNSKAKSSEEDVKIVFNMEEEIKIDEKDLMAYLFDYKNYAYPNREVPTIEEIKVALNTFERTEADDKILYFASWRANGGHKTECYKDLEKARKQFPEYADKDLDSLTVEDWKKLIEYIEEHPEVKNAV